MAYCMENKLVDRINERIYLGQGVPRSSSLSVIRQENRSRKKSTQYISVKWVNLLEQQTPFVLKRAVCITSSTHRRQD